MPKRNVYHPSLRAAVCLTRNPRLLPDLVPYNTAVCWIRRGPQDVVALEPDEFREALLLDRVSRLERQNATLRALVVLLITVMRIIGVDLERARVPNADDKLRLLKAIKSARRALPIAVATKIIGISPARYYAWVEADAGCALPDTPSCPRTKPTQLTFEEVHTMREMVTSKLFRHMSVRALALHAQRLGRLFAHPGTWCGLIREHAWIRPRRRLYPPKPKVGLRATAPNQVWHLDRTIIKPLDGTKAYLSCIIDNFSRRILAWQLTTDATPDSHLRGAGRGCKVGGEPIFRGRCLRARRTREQEQHRGSPLRGLRSEAHHRADRRLVFEQHD